ncbi:glycine-rich domain-containing protein [Elizabethkingia meningoseptica]|uniref:glycine-rich domain-containing protein n=1 Tax=Elizabethkingia meningoseptica TaxID=238 RepID=UPI003891DE29
METKPLLRDEFLWNRIMGFSLDAPDAEYPFSKKLAKEENWSPDFTKKAIEEYKKFIYLCCIFPNGASPSKIVDKVWHMHLIYTWSYWEEFCPVILKRNIHHHPSKGGNAENNKHNDWFLETLENYKAVFHSDAPEDIWLQKENRVIKKHWWQRLRAIPFSMLLLMLTSCNGETVNTLIYTVLIILVVLGFSLFKSLFQNNDDENDGNIGSDGSGSCEGGSSCGGGCGGCSN